MARDALTFFDSMADGYETLEPWYEHLYATLHTLLRSELRPPADMRNARALDAACGTGFQVAILVEMGYAAHGVDLSHALLRAAHPKVGRTPLVQGDLHALPYRDGSFAAATCCGSALSYVADAGRALAEIARVLRPGGRLLVECEGRVSLDLGWAWLSGLVGDPLRYELTPGDVWRAATTRSGHECRLRYPGYGELRLFGVAELARLLRDAGLDPLRVWGIHSVTNLLPSTVLHRPRLGRLTCALYRMLCAVDRTLATWRPAARLANSLVALAVKRPS